MLKEVLESAELTPFHVVMKLSGKHGAQEKMLALLKDSHSQREYAVMKDISGVTYLCNVKPMVLHANHLQDVLGMIPC